MPQSCRTQPAPSPAMRRSIAAALALGLSLAYAGARAQLAYDAAFVSQIVPAFIALQAPAAISITLRNTGTATWYRAEQDVFLSTQEPQDNFFWCIQDNRYNGISGNRVLLPYDVAPGQEVTFDFVVKPMTCRFAATPPLRFRVLSRLYGTFGEETPDPGVVVSNPNVFVSQQVPSVVPAGARILVTQTFRNTMPSTWQTTDGYTLAAAGAAGDTTWGVEPVPLPTAVAPQDTVIFTFYIVAPTTIGTYNFQWRMNDYDGTPFGAVSPATSVQVVAAGPPNYQGLWWNAPVGSESGWGMNFAHQGDTIFATWFTYDAAGDAWWLAMTAPLQLSGVYSGTILAFSGPPFNAVPFSPQAVGSATVGSGTLSFTDANTGTFTYTVNGIAQSKTITRQVFDQLPTCTFGLLGDMTLAYNYQDLWWASPAGSESGWGMNLTHQGNTIFATWFTYSLDGTPLWLSATAPKTAATPATYEGTLYRTSGPPFSAVPFLPAGVTATAVGKATFTFTNGNTGTFAYTVNDVSQSKAITREIFALPGTVCQ